MNTSKVQNKVHVQTLGIFQGSALVFGMSDTCNDLLSCSGDSAVWFTLEMWSPSLEILCFLKSFLVKPSCICYFTK